MKHIRQINSVGTDSYTIVDLTGYIGELEQHPVILKSSDYFEISGQEIPEEHQVLSLSFNQVPFEVALWRIRVVIEMMGLTPIIESALEQLPEPTKTAAKAVWKFGTTIERQSPTVFMIQQVLGKTEQQLDEMFIQADNIDI